MELRTYYVIGVMSGTSLDGIDLVCCSFKLTNKWSYEILNSKTINYDDYWLRRLQRLVKISKEELLQIDIAYTAFLASVIKDFIERNDILKLDAVCSHGHTALHQPENGVTYQIGNRPEISKILKQKVVCDFRVQDVRFGGQGAPLVPIGDKMLFSEYEFCLNLGGFANISLDMDGERIAYDVCPVNIVLNKFASKLGLPFDKDGEIARSGKINKNLLVELNALSFYGDSPPKSLGLEWVEEKIFPLIKTFSLEVKDILSTFCEHCAIQIANELNIKSGAKVLVTGGGVYNSYLVERIKCYSKNEIIIPSKNLIEFKEALIFAFLGVLKLRNEINCLKSVTGATKDHCSGVIYAP